jgi:hypothetical protein
MLFKKSIFFQPFKLKTFHLFKIKIIKHYFGCDPNLGLVTKARACKGAN